MTKTEELIKDLEILLKKYNLTNYFLIMDTKTAIGEDADYIYLTRAGDLLRLIGMTEYEFSKFKMETELETTYSKAKDKEDLEMDLEIDYLAVLADSVKKKVH